MSNYRHVYPPQPASGLTREECRMLREAVAGVAPNWSVDIQHDPAGEVLAMVVPPGVDDAEGPVLVVHRVGLLYCLDQYRWDTYSAIGAHDSVEATVSRVRLILTTLPRRASPTQTPAGAAREEELSSLSC
jgi:hypothetical protein